MPAAITAAALAGRPPIAVATVELFVDIFGAEAGNLALKLKATGGVYVGGGIAPRIVSKLTDGRFRDAFCAKGRFEQLLGAVPVKVLLDELGRSIREADAFLETLDLELDLGLFFLRWCLVQAAGA